MPLRLPARLLVSLLSLLLLSFPGTGCGPRGSRGSLGKTFGPAQDRGALRVAIEPTFRPFEYVEGGELVGFDVDLARDLATALGVKVEFVRVEWSGIIATLKTAKADLIISGMTRTEKRARQVAFSEPYFRTATCLLVSTQRGQGVRSISDLDQADRRIVVKLGTTGETAAREKLSQAQIVPLPDDATAAAEVANGRADALLYDRRPINLFHAKYPKRTFVLPAAVTIEPYSVAMRRGDAVGLDWLNAQLDALRKSGRLEELYAKHGIENADD